MRWLLELVGSYFTDLALRLYHEKALILTEHLELVELSLQSAKQLQLLIISGTNYHLEELTIMDSRLDTIPRSIANLTSLRSLELRQSKLRVLDLGIFCPLTNLESLEMEVSDISTLRPANPSAMSSVKILRLSSNRLTSFDAAHLVSFQFLQELYLSRNQIDTFFTGTPNLDTLVLSSNGLKSVDLKYFEDFKNLNTLDLSYNRLTSVQTSQATLLPRLGHLTLDNNLLDNIDPTNWYFPSLTSVRLANNRLQAVPSSIYRSNVSRTISIDISGNPIRCGSMAEYVDYVLRLDSLYRTCRIEHWDLASVRNLEKFLPNPSTRFLSVQVQRLTTGTIPLTFLLVNVSRVVNSVVFGTFHEPMLLLPTANMLHELVLQRAPNLQNITAQPNIHLNRLEINGCLLSMVPPSLRNLLALKMLTIKECTLKVLNLALLATFRRLEMVSFAANHIASIQPAASTSATLTIHELDLSANRLQRLIVNQFAPLRQLRILNLQQNQLRAIDSQPPGDVTTLPYLNVLFLSNNRLQTVDLGQLKTPNLQHLVLSSNELASLPSALNNLTKLEVLSLKQNALDAFDFAELRELRSLLSLEISDNRLQRVWAAHPVELPNLSTLVLANNALKLLELQQLTAPRLAYIDLTGNLLTMIPAALVEGDRALQLLSLVVSGNPLTCATLERYRSYIERGQLETQWQVSKTEFCTTEQFFVLDDKRKSCCSA
ncbi:insulin-like growth factor-binding protein complex acid labile subunit [Anopheles darlingi]|uniref:insulin-like growth factor-binding protein complex acid labile subunit n=1 Tax=Anopheles darlingi TaxID=43151 RepID=UPI0021006584|nr:insulin-like growth factor-binding protein complex acid labile subunit [Anopheles darlingi]